MSRVRDADGGRAVEVGITQTGWHTLQEVCHLSGFP